LTGYSLRVSKNITGSVSSTGIQSGGAIQSDVTSDAQYFSSAASTAAASFTITDLAHYVANQGTFGVGSTVTKQYGYRVAASLIGATNNYAFFSDIPIGTNRWNLYMNGTAANYLAGVLNIGTTTLSGFTLDVNGTARVSGQLTANSFVPTSSTIPTNGMYLSGTNTLGFATNGTLDMVLDANGALGIGSTTLTGLNLRVSKNITGQFINSGGSFGVGVLSDGQIQSDEVGGAAYFRATITTQAATFTAGSVSGYAVEQGTIGASSVISNQYGFVVGTSLVGATNNYGFASFIPAGTNRWNLFMNGTANNYMAGSLFLGVTSSSFFPKFVIGGNATGGVNVFSNIASAIVQSDVTTNYQSYRSAPSTQATAFTLGNIQHFQAIDVVVGSGSTITNQYGFNVAAMTGATNNYGFFGNIASGTNRWNLYMNGTAANYMAGKLNIGTTSIDTTTRLHLFDSTNGFVGLRLEGSGQYDGSDWTLYASSNPINSSNDFFGIYNNSNTDSATIGYKLIVTKQGTAALGTITPNASARLQVDSSNQGFLPPRLTTTQKNAIATPAAGLMVYDTSLNQMSYYNGTLWINF